MSTEDEKKEREALIEQVTSAWRPTDPDGTMVAPSAQVARLVTKL